MHPCLTCNAISENAPYLLTDHPDAGFNQRMTDIQASLGTAQMDRASEIVSERAGIGQIYNDAFSDFFECLKTPSCEEGYVHGYQSYPCLFMPKKISILKVNEINAKRNEWMDDLQKNLAFRRVLQLMPFIC